MINLQNLLDDVKCYETVRRLRWPDGVRCPHCGAAEITKQGRDTTQPARRKYHCERCHRRFDALTETVLAGRHQPLRVWILCLYFMGLNLSNAQIAQALGLNPDDVQRMTEPLRDGIVARQPEPIRVGGRGVRRSLRRDRSQRASGRSEKKKAAGVGVCRSGSKRRSDCSQEHSGEDRCIIHSTRSIAPR
nr:transposase [Candidatus Competibacter phosphatis]